MYNTRIPIRAPIRIHARCREIIRHVFVHIVFYTCICAAQLSVCITTINFEYNFNILSESPQKPVWIQVVKTRVYHTCYNVMGAWVELSVGRNTFYVSSVIGHFHGQVKDFAGNIGLASNQTVFLILTNVICVYTCGNNNI